MPAPSAKWWKGRAGYAIYELLLSWWRHRASFLISVGITIGALALYYFAFLGDYAVPFVDLLQRVENSALDTRFRYRPETAFPADQRRFRLSSSGILDLSLNLGASMQELV